MMKTGSAYIMGALGGVGKRRSTRGGFASNIFTMLLFAIISLFLLVVLAFGTVIYAQVNDVRDEAQLTRASLGLLSGSLKMSDKADALGVGQGPEGDALVLTEHTDNGDYEVRFYLHDGQIVQEYSRDDAPYRPERATTVAKSSVFHFNIDGSLVEVTTDQGTIAVAMRCMGDA